MEALDTRHSLSFGLPSINNLDALKREEMDRSRSYAYPAAPAASAQSAVSSVPGSLGGLLSPPDSRRTSEKDDEREAQRPRQSLPSIHELTFAAPAVPPPSAPVSAAQPYYPPPPTTVSPVDHRTRQYSTDLHASQGPSNPYGHSTRSPYQNSSNSTVPPPPPPPPPPAQPDPMPRSSASFSEARPPFSAPQSVSKLPTLHPLQTEHPPTAAPTQSNPQYSSSYSAQPSPAYETPNPHSAGPMNHGYGYQYPPASYPLSAPAPSATNAGYPPTYSAPPRTYPNPPAWPDNRNEEKKINRTSLAPYGESVKRHLESFDLEASLNEMAQGSNQISEFSKYYRQQAHETQRIGMTAQSMPRLEEVDEMLKASEKIQVSLHRMREVIFNHQQASIVEAPKDPRHRPTNGYDHETQSNYGGDDVKGAGGFAGPDSKKRRGRAAPPGRCHSCNRAETPEWRRGPDGARTLCNACGLHYAKLTRKMGGGKQAMSMAGNLRPKNEHASAG